MEPTIRKNLMAARSEAEEAHALLLPAWLERLVSAMNGKGRWTPNPTIPKSLMPSPKERSSIEERIAWLDRLISGETGRDHDKSAAERAKALSKLLMVYANQMGEDEATAHAEAYRMALDDVPVWAVREAVRRWFRGEIGGSTARRGFPPPAPLLRDCALAQIRHAEGQRVVLTRLLHAHAREDAPATEADRDSMKAKYDAFLEELRSAPDQPDPFTTYPGERR